MQHHCKSIWASRPCSNRWQVFPEYLGIRQALKANQPDARGSGRRFAEVALATPIKIAGIVEESLKKAALWNEVKDKLNEPGTSLSGGQQQRLCIARAIAVRPEVILMDEPCSALDPIATLKIEELIRELRTEYTIVIVTHNMQQASRVSDSTAFFSMGEDRGGYLVESGLTPQIFTAPTQQLTEDYVAGRFG